MVVGGNISANVSGIGVVAEMEAKMFSLAQKFN